VKSKSLFAIVLTLAPIALPGCGKDVPTRPSAEGWSFELVASGERIGFHSSLTTTSDGTVHIAYYDDAGRKIFHARRLAAGNWEHTRLDSIGWYGRHPVIKSSPGDTLHLAYKDIYHNDLRYACFDGHVWTYERIDPYLSYGGSPVMLLRTDGIHLLDMNIERNVVGYWRGRPSNWTREGSIYVSRPVSSFGFAIGPLGLTLAIFTESYNYWGQSSVGSDLLLKTTPSPGQSWSQTVLTVIEGRPPSSPVLEYDGDGILHILYQKNSNALHDIGTGFVDITSGQGMIRLQKGSTGDLWLLYRKNDGLVLRHLVPGGFWSHITAIDDLDAEGQYDLHIAADGSIHICVYSRSLQELLYGRWEGVP